MSLSNHIVQYRHFPFILKLWFNCTSHPSRAVLWMLLALYLGRPEAEGCRLDVSFLFVHQQQRFVLYQTEILPCGHMSESEWLTPADMTPTPPGHTHTVRHISTKHTQTLKILNKNAELQKSTNKLKSGWLKKRVHLYHVHWISYEAALMDSFYINHQMTMWNMNVVAASNS